jgi:hypothetical protein
MYRAFGTHRCEALFLDPGSFAAFAWEVGVGSGLGLGLRNEDD